MRRVSDRQLESNYFLRKQSVRVKSPSHLHKSKGKNQYSSLSYGLVARKTSSFSKTETNQSSTNFTNKNKNRKKVKNSAKTHLQKYQKEIMTILNDSATIIQKQWRKYLIVKYRKMKEQMGKKQDEFGKIMNVSAINQNKQEKSFSQINSEVMGYNNEKYYSFDPFGQKRKKNQFSSNTKVFDFTLSGDKKNSHNNIEDEEQVIQQFNQVLDKKNSINSHLRTSSDKIPQIKQKKYSQVLLPSLTEKCSEYDIKQEEDSNQSGKKKKLFLSSNALSLIIQSKQPEIKKQKIEEIKPYLQEDHFIKSQNFPLEKMLDSIQSKLEEKKLKKILALEGSFSNNLITFRSYQKNLSDISSEHSKKLKLLQRKRTKLERNFQQVLEIYENDEKQGEESQIEGIQVISKIKTDKNEIIVKQIDESDKDLSISAVKSQENSQSVIVFEQWNNQKQIEFQQSQQKKAKKQQILISQLQQSPAQELIDKQQKDTLICQLQKISQDNQPPQTNFQQKTPTLPQHNNQNNIFHQIPPPSYPPPSHKKQPIIINDDEHQEDRINYHPINPDIDFINNWLLQISHFILDHCGRQFEERLINVQQPCKLELWRHCKSQIEYTKEYKPIIHRIYKQFQFGNVRGLIQQNQIEEDCKDGYNKLISAMHQSLYECLNKMLLDELIYGRQWMNLPWENCFKIKKIITPEYSKQSLQRAINRVSNLSDYGIYNLNQNIMRNRQFQERQNEMIFLEQIKEIPIECSFTRGRRIYQLSEEIIEAIFINEIEVLSKIFHYL